jgi:hypothetical protein
VKNDNWWFDDRHRRAYTSQVPLGPTLPPYWAFNPGYAQIQTEHSWMTGWMDTDELGHVPLSMTGAELLFEVFSRRLEHLQPSTPSLSRAILRRFRTEAAAGWQEAVAA